MPISRINRSRLLAGFVLLHLLLPAGALAAGVSGIVTEVGSVSTIPEVAITLEGVDLVRDLVTDADGYFKITNLPPGRFSLKFYAFGYRELSQEIDLEQDESLVLDVALVLDAKEIEEMVVKGRANDIESDLQTGFVNLNQKDLEVIPGIVEPDPLRALQILPGVQAASDISSGLYIRGGGPDQTLVMMDGVTVYNPTHAFGFFSTFSNDVVDGVALY